MLNILMNNVELSDRRFRKQLPMQSRGLLRETLTYNTLLFRDCRGDDRRGLEISGLE